MSKFSSLVAIAVLFCAAGAQAAPSREASASGTTLALASVAGGACQTSGACNSTSVSTPASGTTSEPNTFVLMAAGLGVVGLIASRRRQKL